MTISAITVGTNPLYSPTKVYIRQNKQGDILGKEVVISYTRRLDVQEPSLLRWISVLFWTLIHDMWVSLSCAIGAHLPFCLRVRIKNKDTDEVDSKVARINALRDNEDTEEVDGEAARINVLRDSAINSTIQSLRTQTPFTNIGVDQYCTFLAATYPAQYIPNCLLGDGDINNFPQCMGLPTVFIPIVLKERFRDHIVALFITHDPAEDHVTIEFYDSKGLTIADRMDEPIANNPNMTLGQLIAELSDRYADTRYVTVKENTTKHQWDSHNCGIHVCRYFDVRLSLDARDLNQSVGYTNTSIWRTQMIEDLMPTFRQASDKAKEIQRIPASAFDMPPDEDDDEILSSTEPELDPLVPSTNVFVEVLEEDDVILFSSELEKDPVIVIPEEFIDASLD